MSYVIHSPFVSLSVVLFHILGGIPVRVDINRPTLGYIWNVLVFCFQYNRLYLIPSYRLQKLNEV